MDSIDWWRTLSIFWLGLLPFTCWCISTSLGHSRKFLSTISGNYLLSPESWIFVFGVFIYVVCHLSLGLISSSVALSLQANYGLTFLEILMLLLLLLIASVPAQYVLGFHGLIGGLVFSIGVIWMWSMSISMVFESSIQAFFCYLMSIFATGSVVGMASYIPIDVLLELLDAGQDFDRKVDLLGKDARWFEFACFEWLYFYSIIVFLLAAC